MKNIEKPVGNALSEWLGAERVEELKDKITKAILNQVEEDLRVQYDLTIDGRLILELSEEAFEEVSRKIKKMYKDKYLEIAEQAIASIGAGKNEAD